MVYGLRPSVCGQKEQTAPTLVEGRRTLGRKITIGLLAVAVAASLSGCGHIEPWVKPYERSAFADPIMSGDRNPVSSSYMDHVHEVREAARGATGAAGGGCGCN